MELHVVADGGNRIDVAYMDVETFEKVREVRVIRKLVPDYRFGSWNSYTYNYFYGGRYYFPTDYGYFLYWDFPLTNTSYVGIRRDYRTYLSRYYVDRYPSRRVYVRPSVYEPRPARYVNRWTENLSTVRDEYERGHGTKLRRPPEEALQTRSQVSSTLRQYREQPQVSSRVAEGYDKKRRSAPRTGTRSLQTQPELRQSQSYGNQDYRNEDAKSRRALPYDSSRSGTIIDSQRQSRTESLIPTERYGSDSSKTRRGESSATQSNREPERERRAAPSASDDSKRRRSEPAETKTKASQSSSSSSSKSSSSSSSSEDDDEKKKRRR
jgi:hypothetical protein